MKIPNKLKIGARIVPVKRKSYGDISGSWAQYDDWACEIRIQNDRDVSPNNLEQGLLHEIVECLNTKHQYNLQHPVIQSLSENLYQVLVDNKLHFDGEGKL